MSNTQKRSTELVTQIDATLQAITRHSYAKPFTPDLDESLQGALRVLRGRLHTNLPRELDATAFESWSLYTDASFESNGTGGMGGVLVRPDGSVAAWFGRSLTVGDTAPFLSPGHGRLPSASSKLQLYLLPLFCGAA